ncbi:hypothetical protein V8C44DRAFT_336337 [Trichoderma aethiopicum]
MSLSILISGSMVHHLVPLVACPHGVRPTMPYNTNLMSPPSKRRIERLVKGCIYPSLAGPYSDEYHSLVVMHSTKQICLFEHACSRLVWSQATMSERKRRLQKRREPGPGVRGQQVAAEAHNSGCG